MIIDIRAALTTGGALFTAAEVGRSTGTMTPLSPPRWPSPDVLSVVFFPAPP